MLFNTTETYVYALKIDPTGTAASVTSTTTNDVPALEDIRQYGMAPGDRLKIKMSSYQYRNRHVNDKTVSRPSYL